MNKGFKIIILILVIALVVFGIIKFKQYYNDTYVGSFYYTQTPSDQDTSIEERKEGAYQIRGKDYEFTAYNENGENKLVKFSIIDNIREIESEEQLLQPNTYLKINASKNRVINWEIVEEQEIPEVVLKYIEENHK
jgi:uncharacterized protein (TIGR01655 family)